MDNGVTFVIGGGWSLPPGYPNYSSTWIEFLGTDGALFIDNSRRLATRFEKTAANFRSMLYLFAARCLAN
ncbi:MAG: hypothetical protein ACREVD_06710 [Burkholderiales bacterium]